LRSSFSLGIETGNALGELALMYFLAIDRDMRRSRNAQTDLATAETDHRDDDIAPNAQGLIGAATENEHVSSTP
jgi:hypothetical protein